MFMFSYEKCTSSWLQELASWSTLTGKKMVKIKQKKQNEEKNSQIMDHDVLVECIEIKDSFRDNV